MAAAVAIKPMALTFCGWRAAVSSAISEPMEWPMIVALLAPAASISAAVQSAMAAMERERLAVRAAMPGQVGRQHAGAAMREPARQQRPDRVVEPGAVQEDDERQRGIEVASAG